MQGQGHTGTCQRLGLGERHGSWGGRRGREGLRTGLCLDYGGGLITYGTVCPKSGLPLYLSLICVSVADVESQGTGADCVC